MKIPRRVTVAACAVMSSAALALSVTIPAQAATGWRVAYSRHYGPLTNNFSGYLTVVAPGTHNAWAFGGVDLSEANTDRPVAEHWNGAHWRSSTLPSGLTSPIEAASAVSASDIWAVTHLGGDILHWDGTSWTVADDLPASGQVSQQLTGVTAVGPSDVWVFGAAGFTAGFGTWHYDGSTWQQLTTGPGSGISTASALSSASIWAIGTTGNAPQDAIVHYDGSSWLQDTATALSGLQFSDILARSGKSVWVTAGKQSKAFAGFLVHFNGSSWSRTRLPWSVDPGSLAGDGSGGLWLTARDSSGRSWMLHKSHTGTWSRTLIGSGGTHLFDPVLIPGTTSLWGAGEVHAGTGANATVWAHGTIP